MHHCALHDDTHTAQSTARRHRPLLFTYYFKRNNTLTDRRTGQSDPATPHDPRVHAQFFFYNREHSPTTRHSLREFIPFVIMRQKPTEELRTPIRPHLGMLGLIQVYDNRQHRRHDGVSHSHSTGAQRTAYVSNVDVSFHICMKHKSLQRKLQSDSATP